MPAGYKLLDTDHDDDKLPLQYRSHHPPRRGLKKLLLHALGIAAIMYAGFFGIRALARSQTAGRLWRGCNGGHLRNSSNLTRVKSHYQLPSGDKIPSVALGTAAKGEVGQAVKVALEAGYRHIDGAWAYRNEEEVGQAIKDSQIPRSDIWITSKLWNNFHAPEDVEPALDDSLQKLGTDYLDLFLIHWPVAFKKDPDPSGKNIVDESLTADPYPTWKALEEMVEKGKVKNIGISNFNIKRVQNLTANPLKVQPAVNQVELNFWNPQPELLEWSKANNLLLEAYSPLGSTKQVKESLKVPEVQEISKALGITPAQVIISWVAQRGVIVLPKSVTPSRIIENLEVFTLPQDMFDKLEHASLSHKPLRVVNPSKGWGLGYDIFDDYPYEK